MKSVTSFINALGKNYYLSLIIKGDEEEIDFSKYDLQVTYKNNFYYELSIDEIHLKRSEIINEVKELYQEALSEIYINISIKNPEDFESFLQFNIEAAKFKLKIIRNDFYIDRNVSRYNTFIDTNSKVLNLLSLYILKYNEEPHNEIDESILSNIKEFKIDNTDTKYYFDFFYERFSAISFIPMALYNIASQFILDLTRIKNKIDLMKEEKQNIPRIKWVATKTHIGFIMSSLAQNQYIEAPRNKNGEINYTAFAKLIKQNFEVDVTEDTLRKYLNPNDEKFYELSKIFTAEKYSLPHSKIVSP